MVSFVENFVLEKSKKNIWKDNIIFTTSIAITKTKTSNHKL